MEPADETRAYLEFLLPQSLAPRLPGFLRELEARSRELGITDMQLSLTSLEEVFLTIARQVSACVSILLPGILTYVASSLQNITNQRRQKRTNRSRMLFVQNHDSCPVPVVHVKIHAGHGAGLLTVEHHMRRL